MKPECEATKDIKAKRDTLLILFEKTAKPAFLKAAIMADARLWTRRQTEHFN